MKKFGNFICNHARLVVIISIVILFFSLIGMKLTKINYDILTYIPNNYDTVKGQNILTNDFNVGAYSIAIIENMHAKDVLVLEDNIKEVEGVNKVVSLYDLVGTSIPMEMLPSELRDKLHKDNIDLLLITFDEETIQNNLNKALNACINFKEVIKNVKNSNDNLIDNIDKTKDKVDKTIKKINDLPDKIGNVEKNINDFSQGIKEISDGTKALQEGISTLSKYSNEIEEGISKLSNGSDTLSKGITKFNEEGIKKISKIVNGDIKGTVNKTKELAKLGSNYESFAGKSNIKGETKFIYVIDGKVAPKEINKAKKEDKKLSFWDRIVKLFK